MIIPNQHVGIYGRNVHFSCALIGACSCFIAVTVFFLLPLCSFSDPRSKDRSSRKHSDPSPNRGVAYFFLFFVADYALPDISPDPLFERRRLNYRKTKVWRDLASSMRKRYSKVTSASVKICNTSVFSYATVLVCLSICDVMRHLTLSDGHRSFYHTCCAVHTVDMADMIVAYLFWGWIFPVEFLYFSDLSRGAKI